MVSPGTEDPITAIAIVSDKTRCPPDFVPIDKAHDEPGTEADIWKDGFFAFSRVYRYLAISRKPMRGVSVVNVVADLAIGNIGDVVPPGFIPIVNTEDNREKALRKKQLSVRMVPRASAVDAVSDIIILARLKKPPQGYTLAGEIDGLMICFKYATIPAEFPSTAHDSAQGMYPGLGLPYPIHPNEPQHANGAPGNPQPPGAEVASMTLLQRQDTAASTGSGLDGVPFKLHHSLARGDSNSSTGGLPSLQPVTEGRLESEFGYLFSMEQQVLTSQLST